VKGGPLDGDAETDQSIVDDVSSVSLGRVLAWAGDGEVSEV
jgi:hypothetical protein